MENNIEIIRHSLAHIMAYAVKELYPKTKFGIGPAIERVYQAAERIQWEGVHYRKDIGNKALNRC